MELILCVVYILSAVYIDTRWQMKIYLSPSRDLDILSIMGSRSGVGAYIDLKIQTMNTETRHVTMTWYPIAIN